MYINMYTPTYMLTAYYSAMTAEVFRRPDITGVGKSWRDLRKSWSKCKVTLCHSDCSCFQEKKEGKKKEKSYDYFHFQ